MPRKASLLRVKWTAASVAPSSAMTRRRRRFTSPVSVAGHLYELRASFISSQSRWVFSPPSADSALVIDPNCTTTKAALSCLKLQVSTFFQLPPVWPFFQCEENKRTTVLKFPSLCLFSGVGLIGIMTSRVSKTTARNGIGHCLLTVYSLRVGKKGFDQHVFFLDFQVYINF